MGTEKLDWPCIRWFRVYLGYHTTVIAAFNRIVIQQLNWWWPSDTNTQPAFASCHAFPSFVWPTFMCLTDEPLWPPPHTVVDQKTKTNTFFPSHPTNSHSFRVKFHHLIRTHKIAYIHALSQTKLTLSDPMQCSH